MDQEEVAELDITGFGPEDVSHRPYHVALVTRLSLAMTFVELKSIDSEAAAEEEDEPG